MLLKFLHFWILCSSTMIGALVVSWLGYRLKSEDLGLDKGLFKETVIALVVAGFQAGLLFVVWRVMGWTHWLQYLVTAAIAVGGYKLTHLQEMEDYGPFVVALVQLALFYPAQRWLAPIIGDLAHRFPMFA